MSNKLTVEEIVRGIYCSQAPVGIVGRVWTETEIPSCRKDKYIELELHSLRTGVNLVRMFLLQSWVSDVINEWTNGRFYIRGCIVRLEELWQTFIVRLVVRLQYKDRHKTHCRSTRILSSSVLDDARRKINANESTNKIGAYSSLAIPSECTFVLTPSSVIM